MCVQATRSVGADVDVATPLLKSLSLHSVGPKMQIKAATLTPWYGQVHPKASLSAPAHQSLREKITIIRYALTRIQFNFFYFSIYGALFDTTREPPDDRYGANHTFPDL